MVELFFYWGILGAAIALALWGLLRVRRWFRSLISTATAKLLQSDEGGTLRLLYSLAKGFGWLLVILVVLATLGVNVTALLTGLGIGGIAVALAVQSVLGDVLASVAIILDKPFVVGDFIGVGDAEGTVEAIGLKNTRLRATSGEVWIVPNADLIKSRIRNFGRLQERRVVVVLPIQVVGSITSPRSLPSLVQHAVSADSRWRCEHVVCVEWSNEAVILEAVLYLRDADDGAFIAAKHELMLGLQERLREEGIVVAAAVRIDGRERVGSILSSVPGACG